MRWVLRSLRVVVLVVEGAAPRRQVALPRVVVVWLDRQRRSQAPPPPPSLLPLLLPWRLHAWVRSGRQPPSPPSPPPTAAQQHTLRHPQRPTPGPRLALRRTPTPPSTPPSWMALDPLRGTEGAVRPKVSVQRTCAVGLLVLHEVRRVGVLRVCLVPLRASPLRIPHLLPLLLHPPLLLSLLPLPLSPLLSTVAVVVV